MNDMVIAESILRTVCERFGSVPDTHIFRIGLRIGELAGVDAASLRFCFEQIVRDTDLRGVQLEIEPAPRRNYCPACDLTFPVVGFEFGCPSCNAIGTQPAGGDEITVGWVDLEEVDPEQEERAFAAAATD